MKKQLHVFWIGRVHGVGFRYTAESAALELGVRGWVRNLPDGRVEAVCEGTEAVLKKFLEQIAGGPMKPYIQGTDMTWSKAAGEFDDFQIRYF
jgi:acylphosphatase